MTESKTVLYDNKHYRVVITDEALGEDGKYGKRGYAVVNKETNIVEHTTMLYPQALFQADAMSGALNVSTADAEAIEAIDDDIVIQ